MSDSDARVRFEALQCIIRVLNGGNLEMTEIVYKMALTLTEDSCDKIRKLNLRLISIIAQSDPEKKVHARGIEAQE